MPYVACREVVVGAVCATVHATDDCQQWASSHCARTSATANGDLARPPDPAQPQALAQPKLAHHEVFNVSNDERKDSTHVVKLEVCFDEAPRLNCLPVARNDGAVQSSRTPQDEVSRLQCAWRG